MTWIADLERERLELERLIAEQRLDESPIVQLAMRGLRDRLNEIDEVLADSMHLRVELRLSGRAVTGNEVRLETLGPFLDELQETVSSIGQALRGSATTSSSIPRSIKDETALTLHATRPGSVILDLHTVQPDPRVAEPPLFGDVEDLAEPLALEAISRLIDVARAARREGADNDELAELVAPLGARAYKHINDLARIISDGGIDVDMTAMSPVDGIRGANLSTRSARRLRDALKRMTVTTEVVEVAGELRGVSSVRNRFELVVSAGEVISGRVAEEVVPELRTWYENRVLATLEMRTTRSLSTGREYRRYLLLNLSSARRR